MVNAEKPSDAEVLTKVLSTLESLDHDARKRVLRAIIAFFDYPADQSSTLTSVASTFKGDDTEDLFKRSTFSEDRSPTVKSFVLEKQPQTDVDRVACLAYYLSHYMGQTDFKTLDISKLNMDAAQIKFSNAAYAIENAAKAQLLIPGAKGHKRLSALGEVYVQALPDKEAARSAISAAKSRRRRNKVA